MAYLIGPDMSLDIIHLFEDLAGYRCMSCEELLAECLMEVSGVTFVGADVYTLTNNHNIPIGLVCRKCKENFNYGSTS